MAFNKERSDAPMKRRGGRRRKKVYVYCQTRMQLSIIKM